MTEVTRKAYSLIILSLHGLDRKAYKVRKKLTFCNSRNSIVTNAVVSCTEGFSTILIIEGNYIDILITNNLPLYAYYRILLKQGLNNWEICDLFNHKAFKNYLFNMVLEDYLFLSTYPMVL